LLEQQGAPDHCLTRNWAKSVVLWNLALNQDHNRFSAVATIVSRRGDCERFCPRRARSPQRWTSPRWLCVSKFVKSGARRIESNSF
jgi:hypothetical protein